MIIIKRQDDNIIDVLCWLVENVSPNAKPELDPIRTSHAGKQFEWSAANHMWRVVLDGRIEEISISIMDVEKENLLKEHLSNE